MLIQLKKFGEILTSREAGGEALLAFLPTLKSIKNDEEIKIDFQGVSVLTPSWADEFMRPLLEKYGQKVSFINSENPSVQAALQFANPKLDLVQITVFDDTIVFDEKANDKIYDGNKTWLVLTFPYSDGSALKILTNNHVKKIRVLPVDNLSNSRLKAVVEMLEKAGIKTTVDKGKKLS